MKRILSYVTLFATVVLAYPFQCHAGNDYNDYAIKAALLYQEDFENASFTSPGFSVVGETGHKMLNLNALSAVYSLVPPVGPALSGEVAVEADVMQTGCNGASGGQVSLGLLSTRVNSSTYKNYRFAYHDGIKYDQDAHKASGTELLRDRISISRTEGSTSFGNWYIAGVSPDKIGILKGSRDFFDFYKMTASVCGGILSMSVKDRSGVERARLLAPQADADYSFDASGAAVAAAPLTAGGIVIGAHSTQAYIDNLRAYSIEHVTGIYPQSPVVKVFKGSTAGFKLYGTLASGGSTELAPQGGTFRYDSSGFSVSGNSIIGRREGTYTLTAAYEDVNTGAEVSCDITVEVLPDDGFAVSTYNLELNQTISYSIREDAELICADGGILVDPAARTLTAVSKGAHTITIHNAGASRELTFCVNDSGETAQLAGLNAVGIQLSYQGQAFTGQGFQLSVQAVDGANRAEIAPSALSLTYEQEFMSVNKQSMSVVPLCDGFYQIVVCAADASGVSKYAVAAYHSSWGGIIGKQVIADSFDGSGNLGVPPAETEDGTWPIASEESSVLGESGWRDYRVEGRFKIGSVIEQQAFSTSFDILLRRAAARGTVAGGRGGIPFSCHVENSGSDYIRIGELSGPELNLNDGNWHCFSVSISGSNARFSVDDKVMLADSVLNSTGGFSFRSENCVVYLDDIKVMLFDVPSSLSAIPMGLYTVLEAPEAGIFDTFDLNKSAGLCIRYGDGNEVRLADGVTWQAQGDALELWNGHIARFRQGFDGDGAVLAAAYGREDITFLLRARKPKASETEYITRGIGRRREDILYLLLKGYDNGIDISTPGSAVSSVARLCAPMLLYPSCEDYSRVMQFLLDQCKQQEPLRASGSDDFHIMSMLIVMLASGDRLNANAETLAQIEQHLLEFDYSTPSEGMSENHKLFYYTCGMLSFERHRGSVFFNGNTGEQNIGVYREYIRQWVDRRLKFGMGEYDSGYYFVDIGAMEALYTYVKDPECRRMAYDMLNLLYGDLISDSIDGNIGGAQSRVYVNVPDMKVFAPLDVMFDTSTVETDGIGMQAVPFLAGRYSPPSALVGIARDRSRRYDNIERKQVYQLPDDPAIIQSLIKYTHVTPSYTLGSVVWQQDVMSLATQTVDKYYISTGTYSSPTRVAPGFSELPWALTFAKSDTAVIFDSHPGPGGTADSKGAHSYFAGDHGCMDYKYFQNGNVLLGLHRITKPGELGYTHFWINKSSFDEIFEEGGWIFVRKNDVFAAIRPLKDSVVSGVAYEWGPEDQQFIGMNLSGIEVRVNSTVTAFVCEVADKEEFSGSFEQYRSAILARPLSYDGMSISYTGINGRAISLHYNDESGKVDGVAPFGANTPRFQSPYMNGGWSHADTTISYGGQSVQIPCKAFIDVQHMGGGSYGITSVASDSGGVLMAALYDSLGRMKRLTVKPLDDAPGGGGYAVQAVQLSGSETCKVFVWDGFDALKPLCQPVFLK